MKKKDKELGEIVVVIMYDDDESRDYRKRKELSRGDVAQPGTDGGMAWHSVGGLAWGLVGRTCLVSQSLKLLKD